MSSSASATTTTTANSRPSNGKTTSAMNRSGASIRAPYPSSLYHPLPEAPTFYPTHSEFTHPHEYIHSLIPQIEPYGIAKVVPPERFLNMMGLSCDEDSGKIVPLSSTTGGNNASPRRSTSSQSSTPNSNSKRKCPRRRKSQKPLGFVQSHHWSQMRVHVKQQNVHQLMERVKKRHQQVTSQNPLSSEENSMKSPQKQAHNEHQEFIWMRKETETRATSESSASPSSSDSLDDDVEQVETYSVCCSPSQLPSPTLDPSAVATPPRTASPASEYSRAITPNSASSLITPEKRKAQHQLVNEQRITPRRRLNSSSAAPSLCPSTPSKTRKPSTSYYCRTSLQSDDIAVPGADLTEMTEKTFGFPRLPNVYFLREYKKIADAFKWEYWNMKTMMEQDSTASSPISSETSAPVSSNKSHKRKRHPSPCDFTIKKLGRNPFKRVNGVHYGNQITEQHRNQMEDGTTVTYDDIEQEYWNVVEHDSRKVIVQYGSDLDAKEVGTLFPKGWDNDWNLNRLAITKDSLLHYLHQKIPGVSSPMLYVGMMFSSFCWHTEDNYLPATNFIHYGAKKTWYGVPGSSAIKFESVMKESLQHLYQDNPNLIHGMITQLSPRVLVENGVPVYTIDHEPGTFIITLPRVFHAGFNHGFNIAESINFAPACWVPTSRIAVKNYRECKRPTAFSHDKIFCNVVDHLDQFDNLSAEAICSEVKVIVENEKRLRERASKAGVSTVKSMSTRSRRRSRYCKNDSDRDYFFCCVCNQDCYLSSVTCPCLEKQAGSAHQENDSISGGKQVYCLHHFDTCSCDASQKVLNIRYTSQQLDEMRAKAEDNLAAMCVDEE